MIADAAARTVVRDDPTALGRTVASQPSTGSSARNAWSGTITDIDRLGDRVPRRHRRPARRSPPRSPSPRSTPSALRPGDDITASVKATDIEVYPS